MVILILIRRIEEDTVDISKVEKLPVRLRSFDCPGRLSYIQLKLQLTI